MNAGEVATIGGFIIMTGGVLIMFGSLKNKLENACERQKEDREDNDSRHERERDENREKFQELYTSRNAMNEGLVKLSTLVEEIFKQLNSINGKIDKALEK